jgi:hypothetical protein
MGLNKNIVYIRYIQFWMCDGCTPTYHIDICWYYRVCEFDWYAGRDNGDMYPGKKYLRVLNSSLHNDIINSVVPY